MSTKLNKVLLINDSLLQYGGAETYLHGLSKLLNDKGIKTTLLGSTRDIDDWTSLISRWYSLEFYNITVEAINNFKPDLIHVQSFTRKISPSTLVACSRLGVPIIQTVHDFHFICPKTWMIDDKNKIITKHNSDLECILHHLPKRNIAYTVLKSMKVKFHSFFLEKYITHFICPSTFLKELYSNKYGSNRVSFLPNFIDTSRFSFTPIKNYNELIFVGRLTQEKGVELLIRAMKEVVRLFPKIHLNVVGDGPEHDVLVDLSRELGLTKNITFTRKTSQKDMPELYKKSTAVIIPSVWVENGPLVGLEGMAVGRPLIGADAGGILDLIKNDFNGYTFSRDNYHDLSKKIIKLFSGDNVNKFSNNQKKMIKNHLPEYYSERLLKLYHKILKTDDE